MGRTKIGREARPTIAEVVLDLRGNPGLECVTRDDVLWGASVRDDCVLENGRVVNGAAGVAAIYFALMERKRGWDSEYEEGTV